MNPSGFFWGESARDAIYSYKRLATMMLAEAHELAAVRGIEWIGPCSSCGGTGVWADHYTYPPTHSPCRSCQRTGKKRLRFIETTLPDGQVWHHPFDHGQSQSGREVASAVWAGFQFDYDGTHRVFAPDNGGEAKPFVWQPAEDWQPRLPGERSSVEDTAGLLNLVEAWLLEVKQLQSSRWILETALRERIGYRLDLGRPDRPCFYCDATKTQIGIGSISDLFHWAIPVCAEHEKAEREKNPPSVLMTPNIAIWAARRAGLKIGADRRAA